MRSLQIFFTLLLISIECIAQLDTMAHSVYYADRNIKKINGKPYTGIDSSYSSSYTPGEIVLAIETYVDGYKTELRTYYENGNPERLFYWKNGIRDGISKGWYKSGKVMFDFLKENGKDVGTTVMFYENGLPKSIIDNQNGITIGFYENGKTRTITKKIFDTLKCKNMNAFEETGWYESGQLAIKRIENCGKQSFEGYYNDSTLCYKGTQIDMSLFKVGDYTEWYINGKKKNEEHYKDGTSQKEANIKTGTWKYWNEKGQLMKEEFYENNELKKTKTYIPEKKRSSKGLQ